MPLTETQRKFLETFVVGSALPKSMGQQDVAGEDRSSVRAAELLAIWRNAKESTDGDIAALQSKLKSSGHPDLERVAELGLNGVTEGNQVAMIKCLMDFGSAGPEKLSDAKASVLTQLDAYRAFLAKSKKLALIEDNPFGVKVSVRARLNGALDEIGRVLGGIG